MDTMFALVVGEYETATLGVVAAPDQEAADRVASILTNERAQGYTITSGPLAGAHSWHARDLVAVRAERVPLFDLAGREIR